MGVDTEEKKGCSEASLPLPTSVQGDKTHLAGGSGRGARQHRRVGDLHVQVIIVYERPSPLHLARLESVRESPEVRIPEEPAVGVVGGGRVLVEALLVVADLGAVRALLAVPGGQGPEAGLGRGAILGAVVLHHEVVDAVHGRVVGQVSPAGAGRAAGAVRVGPERRAELGRLLRARLVRARRGRPELRVALEDLAWRRHWGRRKARGSALDRPQALPPSPGPNS